MLFLLLQGASPKASYGLNARFFPDDRCVMLCAAPLGRRISDHHTTSEINQAGSRGEYVQQCALVPGSLQGDLNGSSGRY